MACLPIGSEALWTTSTAMELGSESSLLNRREEFGTVTDEMQNHGKATSFCQQHLCDGSIEFRAPTSVPAQFAHGRGVVTIQGFPQGFLPPSTRFSLRVKPERKPNAWLPTDRVRLEWSLNTRNERMFDPDSLHSSPGSHRIRKAVQMKVSVDQAGVPWVF